MNTVLTNLVKRFAALFLGNDGFIYESDAAYTDEHRPSPANSDSLISVVSPRGGNCIALTDEEDDG